MRVTQSISDRLYHKYNNSMQSNMLKNHTRIMSSKQYMRASEDSINASKAMIVRRQLLNLDTYDSNLANAKELFNAAEASLSTLENKIFLDVQTEIVRAANDTYNAEDFDIIATALDQYAEAAVETMNSEFAERNLFGGTNNSSPAFAFIKDTITAPKLSSETPIYEEFSTDMKLNSVIYGTDIIAGNGAGGYSLTIKPDVNMAEETFTFAEDATFDDVMKQVNDRFVNHEMTFDTETGEFSIEKSFTIDKQDLNSIKIIETENAAGFTEYNADLSDLESDPANPANCLFTVGEREYSVAKNATIVDIVNAVKNDANAYIDMDFSDGEFELDWKDDAAPVISDASLGKLINTDKPELKFNLTKDTVLSEARFDIPLVANEAGEYAMTVNGTDFIFNGTETMEEIANTVTNNADAGVIMTFDETTGSFNLEQRLEVPDGMENPTSAGGPITADTLLKDISFDGLKPDLLNKYRIEINNVDFVFTEDTTVADVCKNVSLDPDVEVTLTFDETLQKFQIKPKAATGVILTEKDGSNLIESLMNKHSKTCVTYNGIPVDNLQNAKDFPASDPIYSDIGLGITFDDEYNIDPQTAMDISLNGAKITGCGVDEDGNSLNFLQQIFDAAHSLKFGDNSEIGGFIDRTNASRNLIISEITTFGANQNSIEFYTNKNEDYRTALKERQNAVEGCDMETEITQYEATKAAYDAVLKMSANILPTSIFDFI